MKISRKKAPGSRVCIGDKIATFEVEQLGIVRMSMQDGSFSVQLSCKPRVDLGQEISRKTCSSRRLYQLVLERRDPRVFGERHFTTLFHFGVYNYSENPEKFGTVVVRSWVKVGEGRGSKAHRRVVKFVWQGREVSDDFGP